MTTYGLLIYDGVEELDFQGPRSVLSISARMRDDTDLVLLMALWLIGSLHGRDHARAVRRHMQYDPAPPYLADEPTSPSGRRERRRAP